jgi:hypothetical protein
VRLRAIRTAGELTQAGRWPFDRLWSRIRPLYHDDDPDIRRLVASIARG